jgi:hypothetical protein
MNSLPTPDEQEAAFEKLIKLRYWRLNSDESEEYIATRRLGFESAEHMYQQLKKWQWPDWAVYPKPPKPPREARGGGDTEDLLPPRDKAQELFRPLVAALQYGVEQLDLRKEYRQGGRFVAWDVQNASVLDASEATRDALSKGLEKLPKGDYDWQEGTAVLPGGAAAWPPEPLTTLIALYALAEEPLKALVEALHREPSRADWERIEKYSRGKDGLIRRARQLATAACGWKLDRGRHPEEIDREQHNAALYVTRRAQEGASYEEILLELQSAPGFLKELKEKRKIALSDVERLAGYRFSSP